MANFFSRNSGILIALASISIVFMMVLPMPTILLDMLLALNISVAVVIFVLATYLKRPLDFSTFPSVLLIVTLFRLALNISSTRLILTRGDLGPTAAGSVIAAFGDFVVGGNYAVGIVIFLILVLINFIVITKGSGRIAEVSARFTLDSMPGKQMAIDADLNAGLIDEREALARRQEVSREADFYGTMDGASKFVRGDAVAGLIITAINILGGLIIGVLQKDLGIGEAAQIYTTLTIGDGLVTQMPALVVSTAAGMLVSRAGDQSELGDVLPKQIAQRPAALGVAGGVVFAMGMVPGLPFFPFAVLGSTLAGAAAYSANRIKEAKLEKIKAVEEAQATPPPEMEGPEEVGQLLQVDALELEVGYGLLFLVDPAQGGDLLDRIRSIRRQTALELGVVVPPVRIRDNLQLLPTEYMVLIKGVEVARSELKEGHFLAMNPGLAEAGVDGIPTKEPAFGLDALWVREEEREQAQVKGYTVVDLSTVVATHLTEIIKANAFELLGRQETHNLLDIVRETSPALVDELVPGLLPLGVIQKVLQNLLRERVSIRDLVSILEALADAGVRTKDPELLTEFARWALRRSISRSFQDEEGQIPVIALSSELEQLLSEAVMQTDQGSYISLPPPEASKVIQLLSEAAEEASMQNYLPLVLAPSSIRMPLRKLSERTLPTLMVMSHNEVDGPVRTLKVVGFEG